MPRARASETSALSSPESSQLPNRFHPNHNTRKTRTNTKKKRLYSIDFESVVSNGTPQFRAITRSVKRAPSRWRLWRPASCAHKEPRVLGYRAPSRNALFTNVVCKNLLGEIVIFSKTAGCDTFCLQQLIHNTECDKGCAIGTRHQWTALACQSRRPDHALALRSRILERHVA